MTPPNPITRRQALGKTSAAFAACVFGDEPEAAAVPEADAPHRITPLSISQVAVKDAFWSPKLMLWRDVTILDCFDKFDRDRGGAMNNFDLVREGITGRHAGPPWYDGLIYEMIRGSADYIAANRNSALEAKLDGYISRIRAAQAVDPSGYVNTYTQTMLPQSQRWGMNGGDDREQHDVYNAGMMIEAGVHYYHATGRAALLEGATMMANLMCDTIGPPPRANVIPGHSGVEEALVKLHLLCRDDPGAVKSVHVPVDLQRYLELAQFFIDARGHYEGRTGKNKSFGAYGQDQAPLAQQASLEGHAVRAALFSTGIAAVANVTDRPDYRAASLRFWESLAGRKMYISGAAGAVAGDEKLGPDYYLPNDGYMETCAAVALAFFAANMNQLYGDARHIDALERALYNAIPGGVQLSGTRYYYQDPLEGAGLRRWEWHECPCCPPMFLKITGALPGLIYAREPGALYVNLFIGSQTTVVMHGASIDVRQDTRYPWDGDIRLRIEPDRPVEFDLYVRVPGWARQSGGANDLYSSAGDGSGRVRLAINGKVGQAMTIERGYARLRRRWQRGDEVRLTLPMPVRQVTANAKVAADRGRVALMRGPVLYCAEAVDNSLGVANLIVAPVTRLSARHQPELLGGVTVAHGPALARILDAKGTHTVPVEAQLVPFYASANRDACAMRVWLAATEGEAVPATLAARSRASASHCWHLDSVNAINDGIVPSVSSDTTLARLSWWDHRGSEEWAQLDFPAITEVRRVRVYWFADRLVNGGCDVPESWRLVYRRGDAWEHVRVGAGYGTEIDRFNEVAFAPVRTGALRIEVRLKPGWSGGIFEWQVE